MRPFTASDRILPSGVLINIDMICALCGSRDENAEKIFWLFLDIWICLYHIAIPCVLLYKSIQYL